MGLLILSQKWQPFLLKIFLHQITQKLTRHSSVGGGNFPISLQLRIYGGFVNDVNLKTKAT